MTYYADLTPYTYGSDAGGAELYNIGWLDAEHAYPQGSVSTAFVDRLWKFCCRLLYPTRGFHICEFCTDPVEDLLMIEHEGDAWFVGTAEIRVLGAAGRIYAAPDMLYHYVTTHGYRPPDEFVTAVLAGPWPGTPAYEAAIQQHNWEEPSQWVRAAMEERAQQRKPR